MKPCKSSEQIVKQVECEKMRLDVVNVHLSLMSRAMWFFRAFFEININQENIMKISMVLFVLGMFVSTTNLHAAETLLEKSEAQKNEVKRDASKAINRIDEETCTGTDTECAKKKLGHRAEEAKDAIKDTSSEVKNKID